MHSITVPEEVFLVTGSNGSKKRTVVEVWVFPHCYYWPKYRKSPRHLDNHAICLGRTNTVGGLEMFQKETKRPRWDVVTYVYYDPVHRKYFESYNRTSGELK